MVCPLCLHEPTEGEGGVWCARRACKKANDYDEETAYESYMNPEPGFQSGPGDSANAD